MCMNSSVLPTPRKAVPSGYPVNVFIPCFDVCRIREHHWLGDSTPPGVCQEEVAVDVCQQPVAQAVGLLG
jgi:hypothetical protein